MKHILIVEQDERLSEALKMMLEHDGHKVTSVADAKAAYDKVDKNAYDLVVSDVTAPYASGYELLVNLKAKNEVRDKKVPLVVVSDRSDESSVLHCFKIGVDDYLRKPLSAPEFLIRINRFLDIDKY